MMPPRKSVYMRKLKTQLQAFMHAKDGPQDSNRGLRSRDSDASMQSLPRGPEIGQAGASGSSGAQTEVPFIYGYICSDCETVCRGHHPVLP
jgi:hypothetical protein